MGSMGTIMAADHTDLIIRLSVRLFFLQST